MAAMNASYGIEIVLLARIGAGAVTDNYVASDHAARRCQSSRWVRAEYPGGWPCVPQV